MIMSAPVALPVSVSLPEPPVMFWMLLMPVVPVAVPVWRLTVTAVV